jgi:hypothetical protein
MTKREAKRALATLNKIAVLNKRETELLATIPARVADDSATVVKIIAYGSLLKRQAELLRELATILEQV